jgi:hypothetical protein
MAESLDTVAARILDSICRRGYHYEPDFGANDDDGELLVRLASTLGELDTIPGTAPELPVLVTEPAADAPGWKPFDRPERIGWHNDFSTIAHRPILSLAWIARADPEPGHGDWRAASCVEILGRLASSEVERLRRKLLPFGYLDSEHASLLPLISPVFENPRIEGLRFYGRSLREGARLHQGFVPPETERLIAEIEGAADAVGETLACTPHALLVCHNGLALHDRTEQTAGGSRPRRKSILCFVARLHEPGLSRGGPEA